MVVCPCGVMVPAAGVGRLRRGPRTPSCFDTSSSTVTTQPKDTQEPASVDKLTAANNDQSGIPRPLSRINNKNKGTSAAKTCGGDDNNKSEHASRTTLALATTESGRYVGTRPLRSNRSPTPTLHRIPLTTSTHQKNITGSGRPSKHLPAVRTSPTSPQDKQQQQHQQQQHQAATRDPHRLKGPIPLPRNNALNHRINDMNATNQRRLLKQNLSPQETSELRTTTTIPSTKPCSSPPKGYPPSYDPLTPNTPIYQNYTPTWPTQHEMIYENLRVMRSSSDEEATGGDVKEESSEVLLPDTHSSLVTDSHHSTLWLTDSWKYNTVKKAPDFNIFDFSDVDTKEEQQQENQPEDKTNHPSNPDTKKKRFRSKLPTFGRKKDKENRGKTQSTEVTRPAEGQRVTGDNKRSYKHPDGPESPISIHKAKVSRPLTSPSVASREGPRSSRESSPYSSDNDSRTSTSSGRCWRERWRRRDPARGEREGGSTTTSGSLPPSESWSRVSPLISREHHPDGGGGAPSATPSTSPFHNDGGRPDTSSDVSKWVSSLPQASMGSLERVSYLLDHDGGRVGRPGGLPSRHALHNEPDHRDRNPCGRLAQYPAPTSQGLTKGQGLLTRGQGQVRAPPPPTTTTLATSSSQVAYTQNKHIRPPQVTTNATQDAHPCPQDAHATQQRTAGGEREEEEERLVVSYTAAAAAAAYHHHHHSRHHHHHSRHHPAAAATTTTTDSFWDVWQPRPPSPTPSCPSHRDVADQVPVHYHSLPQLHTCPTTPTMSHASHTPQQLSSNTTKKDTRHQVSSDESKTRNDENPRRPRAPVYATINPKQKARAQGSLNDPKAKARAQGSANDPKQKVRSRETTALDPKAPTEGVTAGRNHEMPSHTSTAGLKHDTRLQMSTTDPKLKATSQGRPADLKQDPRSHLPTPLHSKQETRSLIPSTRSKQRPRSKVPTVGSKQETPPQIDTVDSRKDASSHHPTGQPQRGTDPQLATAESKRETNLQPPAVDHKRKTYSDLLGDPELERSRQEEEEWLGGDVANGGSSWRSSVLSTSATSPILPPLPPGLLQDTPNNPSDLAGSRDETSPENGVNLTSVCILSLDLTVDCEELGGNGLKVVNITDNEMRERDEPEHKIDDEEEECESKEDVTIIAQDDNEEPDSDPDSIDSPTQDTGSRSLSASSSSVRFDEKYYEKDNYDSPEDEVNDDINGEDNTAAGGGVRSASVGHCGEGVQQTDNNKTPTINEEDDDDFIDIDCDVQPMETLKRPLVYGYGRGPVRTRRGSTFLEKRLSQASDVSDYLEMDLLESLLRSRVSNEELYQSGSCLDLKETYWDHWQAKNEAEEAIINKNRNSQDTTTKRLPKCPSSKFCYDPEVLLAQVRCPKSLEDATFKQYSSYVKSHIYDHFGNVHEGLKEYGLSYGRPDWISSQPELPDLPSDRIPGMFPLDYSSEPELSNSGDRRQPRPGPPQPHAAPLRPPPLTSRDTSLDSGNWTYLPSSEVSPVTRHPVPLPRSTSSLSHIGPGVYNPWHHLLPDVTPPRTPRHSVYYGASRINSPCGSRPASPSPSRCSLTSRTSESHPQQENNTWDATTTPQPPLTTTTTTSVPPPPAPSSKRSFLPNLSSVMRSPLRKQNWKPKDATGGIGGGVGSVLDKAPHLPTITKPAAPHQSIQIRRLTNISAKSSSSSSSSSSGSSKDSVTTVIRAPPRSRGAKWLMKHFGDNKITRGMAAV